MTITTTERKALLKANPEVFKSVLMSKYRIKEKLKKETPDDDSEITVLLEYHEKLLIWKEILEIHAERENFKPGCLVWTMDWDGDFDLVTRIDENWNGDLDYLCCGDGPEWEGSAEDLQRLTPEIFQKWVNLQPEHYLGVYREMDLYIEPGYENIKFPEDLEPIKETIVDLKKLGL